MEESKHNRRFFLKTLGVGFFLAAGFLWDRMVKTEKLLTARKRVSIPFNPGKALSFHDGFIVVNSDGQTRVFSSHCTHLGCTINASDGDRLVCPCHGSAFDTEGRPVKGPAVRPLEELDFVIDKAANQITVEV